MAGKRIKGLTIEIDGNTTKLQTALKSVDASLSKTQSSLRDVNRLLKLDPHNTELLGQKQKLLADSINNTKSRLETLKKAEKDVQQAIAEGKASQDQYDALKREIVETETKLKDLQKTASSMGFEEFGSKMKSAGEAIEGAGKKLMPLSTTAGAVGVASGKMAMDFEDSMANINTLLSDTKNLDGYEEAIKNMSRETGISLEVMSAGMYQTISSIGDGGKETEKIFKTMGTAAKAGGAEVADAVSLISAGMKGYNSVNDETAQKISDLAFQTAKLGVTTFPEMARSMQPLFPLASSLSMSMEELFGTMATLTGVTGNTSEVTTQLKAVMSGLMKPTGAMKDLLAEYGYANGEAMIQSEGLAGTLDILKEATGGQSDKMAELFGSTEALTAVTALTGPQMDVFKEKLGEMQTATGATSSAYQKLDTDGNTLRETWNNIKITMMELGTALMELLGPIIETISQKVQQFSQWFNGLDESQKKVIATVLVLVTALGPALIIIGNLITAVGTISTAIGALNGFLTATGIAGKVAGVGVTMFSGPMLPIVAIIGAVVAAGVLLWKNWDKIKEKAIEIGGTVKEKFDGIKENISGAINGAKDTVKTAIDKIKGFFDFKWSLPDLKLPHFSITGKFSLKPPQVPHLSVEWYRKAMDTAYMLRQPTIFGAMGGNLLGGGEAGNEMVIGQNKLLTMIQQANAMSNNAMVEAYMRGNAQVVDRLDRYLPVIASKDLTINGKALAKEITPDVNMQLGKLNRLGMRGIL